MYSLIIFFLMQLNLLFANEIKPIIQNQGSFYELQHKRFLEKGGKENQIIEIESIKALMSLIKNQGIPFTVNIKGLENRFNYVLNTNNKLRISSKSKLENENIVSQNILSKGDALFAAGEIYIFRNSKRVAVYISNHSRKFCTPFINLKLVRKKLLDLGLNSRDIVKVDYPSRYCRRQS